MFVVLLAACGDLEPPDTDVAAADPARLAATSSAEEVPFDVGSRPVPIVTVTTAPPPTTTTTAPAPPPAPPTTAAPPPSAPAPAAPVASSGHVNGYPCGGALPPCTVLECESGGNPTAEHGGDRGGVSTASGLWQILDGTWSGFGGYSHAADAPPSVQNQKAAALWDGGAGSFHWSQCL